mmetsp:Transcript_18964/g.47662  ORF Transcript_18964/g.47662 Transcript_18964/m.47662 type:complete len:133 (+) Transcript_18964:122-520(+)
MPNKLHFPATEPTAPVVIVMLKTEMQTEVAQKHGKMSSIFNYKNPAYPIEPQPIKVAEGAGIAGIAMATKQAEAIIAHRIKTEELRAKVVGDVMAGCHSLRWTPYSEPADSTRCAPTATTPSSWSSGSSRPI